MVVSETGAMLSPKMAPEMMAPPRTAASQPMMMPTGYRMGVMAATVPKAAPVASAKAAENRKAATQNAAPERFSFTESHTSPSTSCPCRRIVP